MRCVPFRVAKFISGVTGGIRPKRKYDFLSPRRKMILYVSFLNETHNRSSRPVAYLKGARLERNMDSLRRGGILDYILSIRGKESPRRQ